MASESEFNPPARQRLLVREDDLVAVDHDAGVTGLTVVRARDADMILADWLRCNRAFVDTCLRRHGGVLFRGFRVGGAEGLERLFGAAGLEPMPYTERSSPRREVYRLIYTSTEFPADQVIGFHNENAYASVWPATLVFHCVQPASEGGATRLADCRRVLEGLPSALVATFLEKGVKYVRNYSEELGLPWQVVFGTSDRAAVASRCAVAGYELEWRPGGRLRSSRVAPAVVRHPRTGDPLWFNHAAFFHESAVDLGTREGLLAHLPENELPHQTYYGDGTPIEPLVVTAIGEAYESAAIEVNWLPEDTLVLDNMLISHGRAPFRGARRVLVGMSGPVAAHDVDPV